MEREHVTNKAELNENYFSALRKRVLVKMKKIQKFESFYGRDAYSEDD